MSDLVFLKADTADGVAAFSGSVKVNSTESGDYSRGIRLLTLPEFTITNYADKSRSQGHYVGSPEIYPVVCETIVDKSTISAITCLVQGRNLGDVSISQMTSTGQTVKVLTKATLGNTFISEVVIEFDSAQDQGSGEGLLSNYTLVCDKITQIRNMYDPAQQSTGVQGSQVDRQKIISSSAGS